MESFEQQLQQMWQQGGRELAVAFLRRALSADMTLNNLLSALQFGDVTPHLKTITVRDVFGRQQPTPAAEGTAARPVRAAAAPKARRRRRSAAELDQVRTEVVAMLVAEPGSLNTSQLVAGLGQKGHELDTMRVNALLRGLLKEGLVADLGGKPKAWRATPALRRQNG